MTLDSIWIEFFSNDNYLKVCIQFWKFLKIVKLPLLKVLYSNMKISCWIGKKNVLVPTENFVRLMLTSILAWDFLNTKFFCSWDTYDLLTSLAIVSGSLTFYLEFTNSADSFCHFFGVFLIRSKPLGNSRPYFLILLIICSFLFLFFSIYILFD